MAVNSKNGVYHNALLVEFEFIVDLDLALFRLFKHKYSESPYVDKDFISLNDEYKIICKMLNRADENPLTLLMPGVDTTKLYQELTEKHEKRLLKYASPYDSLYLMNSYLVHASSVEIDVLCKNELEANYISKYSKKLNTIINPDKSTVDIDKYSIIHMKYFSSIKDYKNVEGKYIYISAAEYNYDKEHHIANPILSIEYGDVNIIKLMDLYTQVKYIVRKEENENDLLEHSFRIESARDSNGDSWYHLRFPK